MQIKAIIVDDSRLEIEMLLESVDWDSMSISICGTALNGKKGIELFQREHPDLVITDIQMPVMDGIEMTEKIRQYSQDVCIVFLSSYKEFEYAHAGYALGVKEYILKQDIDSENTSHIFLKLREEILKKKNRESTERLEEFRHFFSSPESSLPTQLQNNDLYGLAVLFFDERLPFLEKYHSHDHLSFKLGHTFYSQLLPLMEPFPVLCIPETEFRVLILWKTADSAPPDHRKDGEDFCMRWFSHIKELFDVPLRLLMFDGYQTLKNQKERYLRLQPFFENRWFLQPDTLMEVSEYGVYPWSSKKQRRSPLPPPPERMDIEQLNLLEEQGSASPHLENIAAQIAASQNIIEAQHLLQMLDVYCSSIWDSCQKKGCLPEQADHAKAFSCQTFQSAVHWFAEEIHCGWTCIHSNKKKSYSSSVETAIDYMKQHLSDTQLDINQTAEYVALSPSRFRAKFKEETGISPNQYLGELRFKRAKKLLLTTCMKLEDIAEEVGFSDGKYFRKIFHQKYGMTPREFREQRGKTDESNQQ